MAITQYGSVTTDSAVNVNTTRVTPHTVGSGTNRLLVYIVGTEDGSAVPSQAPDFGGTPMTLARTVVAGSTRCDIYFLVAPAVATADISITFTNNCDDFCCIAANFAGVDQTAPLGNTQSETEAASPYDVALAIDADSLLISGCSVSSGVALPFAPAAGLAELGAIANGSLSTHLSLFGGFRIEAVPGTYSGGCASGTSTTGSLVAAEFKAAAAGVDASADVVGILAVPEAGVANIVVDATAAAAGLAATAASGVTSQASLTLLTPAGLAAQTGAGAATVAVGGSAAPSGAAAVGQVGAATPAYGAVTAVAGTGGAAQGGSVSVGPEGTAAPTGVEASGITGTASGIVSATGAAQGVAATAVLGPAVASTRVEVGVAGCLATCGGGLAWPRFDTIIALAAAAATAGLGTPLIRRSGWSRFAPRSDLWVALPEAGSGWMADEAAKQAWSRTPARATSWAAEPRVDEGWTP